MMDNWFASWPGQGGVAVLLASAALALTVIVGIVWQQRGRAARRRGAALEAYAEREIARAWAGKRRGGTDTFRPRGQARHVSSAHKRRFSNL